MNIGIIGAGNIGGTVGRLLTKAGHRVRFGVPNPEGAVALVAELGASAGVGDPVAAAEYGEALIFAGPFGAWPEFADAARAALRGKVVIDAANPYPQRDGKRIQQLVTSGVGSGVFVAELLPDAAVVKAFNTIYWKDLLGPAGRSGERLAMAIAGDDARAVEITVTLADQAGFDPVVVGGLSASRNLDPDGAVYAKSMTARQVRAALGLSEPPSNDRKTQ